MMRVNYPGTNQTPPRSGARRRCALAAALAALLCLQALPAAALEAGEAGVPFVAARTVEHNVATANELADVFSAANADGGSHTARITADITVSSTLSLSSGEVTLVSDGGSLTLSNDWYGIRILGDCTLNLGAPDGSGGVDMSVGARYGIDADSNVVSPFAAVVNLWPGSHIVQSIGPGTVGTLFSANTDSAANLTINMYAGSLLEVDRHCLAVDLGYRYPAGVAPSYVSREFNMYGGTIRGPGAGDHFGGAVTIASANCSFTMYDGAILESCGTMPLFVEDGMSPIVVANGGVFRMRGGTIRDMILGDGPVSFEHSAIISVQGGTFGADGGVIEGCTVEALNGSLIAVSSSYSDPSLLGTVDLSGVTFRNNIIAAGGVLWAASFFEWGTDPLRCGPVTISGCIFEGNSVSYPDAYGGGKVAVVRIGGGDAYFSGSVCPLESPVRITDCVFRDNSARGIAGALYVENAQDVAVENCQFLRNTSHAGAGAELKGSETSAVLKGCVFEGNYAHGSDPAASGGGALYVHDGAEVSVTGGRISGNSAEYHGGGVWASSGAKLTMSGVEVSGNTTPAHGGGVSVPYKKSEEEADTVVEMDGCTVSGNAAGEFGGGVQAMSGSVTLTDCEVTGNVAGSEDPDADGADLAEGSHGGGIWAESGLGHVTDAAYVESPATIAVVGGTVSGNRAGDHAGGAGASQGATLEMTGVEVTGNWAGDHGGGALSEGGSSDGTPSEVALAGCEVTGNFAANHGGGVGVAYEPAGASGAAALADDAAGGSDAAGDTADAPAGRMTVTGGRVYGNETGGEGGGACAEAGAYLDLSKTKVYGNSAAVAADGVNVHDGATVLLGPAAAEAELPCGHAVDGWYYDDAGARWYTLVNQDPPVAYPLEAADGVAYDAATGVWAITAGDRSLKDAHGPEPHVPGAVTPPSTGGEVAPPAQGGNGGSAGEQGAGAGTAAPSDRLTAALPSTGDSLALWVGLFAAIVVLAAVVLAVVLWRLRRQRRIQPADSAQ